jgi:hypothetical protein
MLEKPVPALVHAARQIVAAEILGSSDPASAVAGLYRKLLEQLGPLIGYAAVQALMARCVHLAAPEHPAWAAFPASFQYTQNPSALADQLRGCLRGSTIPIASEAAAALLSWFFSLLTTFIGERLTAQVLQGLCPQTPEPPTRKT